MSVRWPSGLGSSVPFTRRHRGGFELSATSALYCLIQTIAYRARPTYVAKTRFIYRARTFKAETNLWHPALAIINSDRSNLDSKSSWSLKTRSHLVYNTQLVATKTYASAGQVSQKQSVGFNPHPFTKRTHYHQPSVNIGY